MRQDESRTLRVYLRTAVRSTCRSTFRDPIQAQRESCRVLATQMLPLRYGITVNWAQRREYVDNATTDSPQIRRPAMSRLLTEVEAGDIVIMRDLTRVSRDPDELLATVRLLSEGRRARLFTYEPLSEVSPQALYPMS